MDCNTKNCKLKPDYEKSLTKDELKKRISELSEALGLTIKELESRPKVDLRIVLDDDSN